MFLSIPQVHYYNHHGWHANPPPTPTTSTTARKHSWSSVSPHGNLGGEKPDSMVEEERVGTFNGYPLYYVNEDDRGGDDYSRSKIHCVGDTHQVGRSWLFRSCEYKDSTLCFDLQTKGFFIRGLPVHAHSDQRRAQELSFPERWKSSSSNLIFFHQYKGEPSPFKVKVTFDNNNAGQFFPYVNAHAYSDTNTNSGDNLSSYLMVDATIVPMERHRLGYTHPSYHFWQELISIYTLLDVFDYTASGEHDNNNLLLVFLKQKLSFERRDQTQNDLMNTIGTKLLGIDNFERYNPYWEVDDFELELDISASNGIMFKHLLPPTSSLTSAPDTTIKYYNSSSLPAELSKICAKNALVGFGQYGFHEAHYQNGTHQRKTTRAQEKSKQHHDAVIRHALIPKNHGKGGFFRRFRAFMMKNLGVGEDESHRKSNQRILFSQIPATKIGSKTNVTKEQSLLFGMQIEYLESVLSNSTMMDSIEYDLSLPATTQIEGIALNKLSIEELIRAISTTKVLVTSTGGGSATSIFLPQGSHLILCYDKWFIDWDYWNNMPHITVHWIPIDHIEDPQYLETFYQLIVHCLIT